MLLSLTGLRADGSFRMTNDSLDYLWNADAPADWFVKFPLKECADLFGLPYTGVIDRPDLQEILLDECRAIKKDFIVNGNPVTGYENKGKGEGVAVSLADGTTVEADVLGKFQKYESSLHLESCHVVNVSHAQN